MTSLLCACSDSSTQHKDFDAGASPDTSPTSDASSSEDTGECSALLTDYTELVESFRSCESDADCTVGFGCSGEPVGTAVDADRLRAREIVADAEQCEWVSEPPGSCPGSGEVNADSPVGSVENYAGVCIANKCEVEPRLDCEDVALYANGRYPVALLDTRRSPDSECSSDNDCWVRTDTNPCGCNDAVPGALGDFDDEITSVVARMQECGTEGLCSCPDATEAVCTNAGKCELASRWPNEPPRASVMVDQPFNVVSMGELGGDLDPPDGIVEEPGAIVSPPNVLEIILAEGTAGGTRGSGVALETPVTDLFIGLAMQCSQWESSTDGDVFLDIHTSGDADTTTVGLTTDANGLLRLRVGIADQGSPPTWLNPADTEFSCDVWHELELLVSESTIQLWLDGTEVFSDTAVDTVGHPSALELQPRWGAPGEQKAQTSILRFDHLRVAGYEAF